MVLHELPTGIAYALTFVAMGLVGLCVMAVAYFPLRGKPTYLVILTTIAIGVIVENLALNIWGPLPTSLPSPLALPPLRIAGAVITAHQLFIFAATGTVLLLQYLFLRHTRFGVMMQATSQDLEMARLVGIRVNRAIAVAFMLGSALSSVAGLLVTPLFLADPTMGGILGLKAFVVSVIGGFGNPPGAVLGGLALGIVETFGARYISSDYRDAYAFLIMILVLFLRPRGLFGERVSERV